ncbi:hypothetical protein [Flavobacterium foetidum]|nr:hypothetical protein [Flavobacterium foetidum]
MKYNPEPTEQEKNNWSQDPDNWIGDFSITTQKMKECFLQRK